MTDDAVSRPVPLDGSPKVDTILQAAWLFGVHIDPARYGLAALPPARQVTVLLAILSAHITSDQVVHAQLDTPSFHERKAYARWATADVRIGWPANEADTHIADMALWMMEWAGFLAEQLTDGRRETPTPAITRLIRAARFAITFVRQQDNPTPITRNIGVPIDKLLGKARDATVSALVELGPLPAPGTVTVWCRHRCSSRRCSCSATSTIPTRAPVRPTVTAWRTASPSTSRTPAR